MTQVSFRKIGLLALATSLSAPAFAEGLNYNYIEGSYIDTEIDVGSFDVDGDGFGLDGSVELGSNVFLLGGWSSQEFDSSVDLDQWRVGIGGHMPIAQDVDLVGSLSYVDAEIDTPFGDLDDDGYGASLGVRARVAAAVEVEGGINYVDLDDSGDDTSFNLGGRYYFTETFALGAAVEFGDDVTVWKAGARLQF